MRLGTKHRRTLAGILVPLGLSCWVAMAVEPTSSGRTFTPWETEDLGTVVELPRNAFAPVPGKDPNGWSFTLEPYAWAIGMSADIGVRNLPSFKVNFGTGDVLRHLDWAVMAKGEIRRGRWGLLGDGLFAQLSASGNPPVPVFDSASLRVQQGMASLALAYRVIDDRRGFVDVYAGARYNYMGFQVNLNQDSDSIQGLSDAVAGRITAEVTRRVNEFLVANRDAIVEQVEPIVRNAIRTRALERAAALQQEIGDTISRRDVLRFINRIRNNSEEYRELIRATAQARIATARNQLTTAIQNRVSQAEQRLAKRLAKEIENALPTQVVGNDWWVDPIVGLRTQINFTRWLFLSLQGDVGGFGAGSEIAWNAQGSVGVNFTRHVFSEAGYRYFYMNYRNGAAIYDGAEAGFFMGVGVRY